ncbi:MAG: hypothetical protein PHE02_09930 [Lachnospiraceae bacterium]|nr:hypothetical protein [Lachnospiraceae bacterium]
MAEDKVVVKKNNLKEQIFIFIVTVAAVAVAGWAKKLSQAEQLRNLVMTILGLFAILFRLRQIAIENTCTDNDMVHNYISDITEERSMSGKYYRWFFFGIILSILFSFMPNSGWPYPVLSVILALYSDSIIGICSTALFIFISVTLNGADFSIFYLYFSCSVIAILLFQKLDDTFKIYIPLFLSELSILVATTAEVLLMDNGRISVESFIIPVINVFISALFYLIFLKYYSATIVHQYRDRYTVIADQEYSLMVTLKKKSKEAYFLAIHTAYFSDKIARKTHSDPMLAKAGSYYHNLSELCEPDTMEVYENLLKENEFPPALYQLLIAYRQKNYTSKEAAIIYFSDTVISSIMYLFKKNKDAVVDYDQVIDMIFHKKITSGLLQKCELSMADLSIMRKIFKEEKLYYDFLR